MQEVIEHKVMEQRSEEWFAIRRGLATASSATVLMAVQGLGLTAKKYALEIVMQPFIWNFDNEGFDTFAMQRGRELEPLALNEYEVREMQSVTQVGFVSKGMRLGCSPDGLVGDDGGLEIKCPQNAQYGLDFMSEDCPKKYLDQVQMSLYVTGRKFWDVVIYNPDFIKGYDYKCWRVEPDPKWVEKFEGRVDAFFEMVEDYKANLIKQE